MDFDSFSHGQIQSKIWLCEQLEPFMKKGVNIAILGSWHNVLGFMLSVRMPEYYNNILGMDIDPASIRIADKITDAWKYGKHTIENRCEDANDLIYNNTDVIINCSAEHFISEEWFSKIPEGKLVCIQSSDVVDTEHPWFVTQPNPSIEVFTERYPMTHTLFLDTLPIRYTNSGYNRFMLIGIK